MDRGRPQRSRSGSSFPRTRGDGPIERIVSSRVPPFPPHARGWTPYRAEAITPAEVSPARAGMDPSSRSARTRRSSFPRTRGDGPLLHECWHAGCLFPPHARGWTLSVIDPTTSFTVSPARAGMDLQPSTRRTARDCFPRTRGDGPSPLRKQRSQLLFPPHARGWTPDPARDHDGRGVSPARAGMDLYGPVDRLCRARFPRTRGDGPFTKTIKRTPQPFPPHARGWTSVLRDVNRARVVSPARAGMDRGQHRPDSHRRGFPRTRGDGPAAGTDWENVTGFPPHARGWTRGNGKSSLAAWVSPARAGMDRLSRSPPNPR